MPSDARGRLFVLSAPSGTGKTTLAERLMVALPRLVRSRSYTSRLPRGAEVEGVDYNFVSRERFEALVAERAFLEWADVFGNLYGTSAEDTERLLAAGKDVLLVIDVKGARQVRARGVASATIFVMPPSPTVLEARLRGRGDEDEGAIRRRLQVARDEVEAFREYDYVVINDDLDSALDHLRAIVIGEQARLAAMWAEAERVVEAFMRHQPGARE